MKNDGSVVVGSKVGGWAVIFTRGFSFCKEAAAASDRWVGGRLDFGSREWICTTSLPREICVTYWLADVLCSQREIGSEILFRHVGRIDDG